MLVSSLKKVHPDTLPFVLKTLISGAIIILCTIMIGVTIWGILALYLWEWNVHALSVLIEVSFFIGLGVSLILFVVWVGIMAVEKLHEEW